MFYTTRLVAVGLAVLALAGGTPEGGSPAAAKMGSGEGAGPVGPGVTSVVTIEGGSEEDRVLAEWAVSRFVAAGLELPPVVVEFVGPSLEPCGGAQATARLDRDPVVVSVCWGSRLVMLHELAHVWEAVSVAPDQQQRFMETRTGVDSWASPDDPWVEQGREHAANVIAWALMEDPMVVGRTYPNDRASLETGFAILTGSRPLHHQGGEPILVDRSAFDHAAAEHATAPTEGIRSGR